MLSPEEIEALRIEYEMEQCETAKSEEFQQNQMNSACKRTNPRKQAQIMENQNGIYCN
jgi:predicted DNA-binding protein (UPF0251 family)